MKANGISARWILLTALCQLIFFHFTEAQTYPKDCVPDPSIDFGEDGPLLLSPYIKACRALEGRQRSNVKGVPKYDGTSFAGYITANDMNHLFFWFMQSEKNPTTSPLVIWLNGGPGISSMQGLLWEQGPISVSKSRGSNLKFRPRKTNWPSEFSVLYIDSPVGVGYSFTEDLANVRTRVSEVADDLYSFLEQFYILFPEFTQRDLYIGGQSYAGKYSIALGDLIHRKGQQSQNGIVFKGIYIGGPLFNPRVHLASTIEMLFNLGSISFADRNKFVEDISSLNAEFEAGLFQNSSLYNIFPQILGGLPNFDALSQFLDNYATGENVNTEAIEEFMKLKRVRKALHVDSDMPYIAFNGEIFDMFGDDFFQSWTQELGGLMDNYKVLVFDGDFDIIVPQQGTELSLLEDVPWSGKDEYREASPTVWKGHKAGSPDPTLFGFVTKVGQFCRVTLKGAGHQVPRDQPEAALKMMSDFIHHGCVQD